MWQALFGERATTKIAGSFDRQEDAASTIDILRSEVVLKGRQLQLIAPNEKKFGKKLEPEGQGITRTAVRSHLYMGLSGLAVGIALWVILYASGWNLIRSTPGLSIIPFVFFPTIAGLLLGGLVTARPDQTAVITQVRDAVDEGKWVVVAHPDSPQQCDSAEAILKANAAEVWRSV